MLVIQKAAKSSNESLNVGWFTKLKQTVTDRIGTSLKVTARELNLERNNQSDYSLVYSFITIILSHIPGYTLDIGINSKSSPCLKNRKIIINQNKPKVENKCN